MKKHKPLIYALILLAINFLIFLVSNRNDQSYGSPSPTPTVSATPIATAISKTK